MGTTMWTTNGSLGLPSRPPAATRPAHVRGRATNVMLARIPSNEYQIRNDDNVEVEIKFNDFEEYNDKFKIKLIFIITSHISLLLASFVSNFYKRKLEAKPCFYKRYLSPGLGF